MLSLGARNAKQWEIDDEQFMLKERRKKKLSNFMFDAQLMPLPSLANTFILFYFFALVANFLSIKKHLISL